MKSSNKVIIIALLLAFCFATSFSQKNRELDSLDRVVALTKTDTAKCDLLTRMSVKCMGFDTERSLKYAELAVKYALSSGNTLRQGQAYTVLGNNYYMRGIYDKALEIYNLSLEKNTAAKNKLGIGTSINNIGLVYINLGNYTKGLEYQFKAIKIREEANDLRGVAYCYNAIAVVYKEKKDYENALKYLFESLKLNEKLKEKRGILTALGNIGGVYHEIGNDDLSIEYHNRSLKLAEEINYKPAIAESYGSMANIFIRQKEFKKAFAYYDRSIEFQKEMDDRNGLADNYASMAGGYFVMKNYKKSIEYFNIALQMEREVGSTEKITEIYKGLGLAYAANNDPVNAYNYITLYANLKDTLDLSENKKHMAEMQVRFNTEKKEEEIQLLQKNMEIKNLEAIEEKNIRSFSILALILVTILALVIASRYRVKKRSNDELTKKNELIEKQKALVDTKNMQIMDSINYAKRIQDAILTSEEDIKRHLPELFIVYLPKDVVSGDFYWFSKMNDVFILVVADCTGHGVPGAFLSMVGSTLLNEIVIHNKVTDPAKIIKELSFGVSNTLSNKSRLEENTDGMDITVCKIDPKYKKVSYAGANHSLFLVKENNLQKIEPQISSINGIFGIKKDDRFETKDIILETGTMVYLSTDGYADQSGYKTRKKFMSSRFEKLLAETAGLSPLEQKIKLKDVFREWKGEEKQVDDVLVIGFKL